MRLRKKRVFVHLGTVVNPDVCVIIADFFMRIISVSWSIVSGTCDNKLIVIFRNDGIRKDAGKVAQKSFGQFGSAGGHRNMARAELTLSELQEHVDHQDHKKFLQWLITKVERRAGKN